MSLRNRVRHELIGAGMWSLAESLAENLVGSLVPDWVWALFLA